MGTNKLPLCKWEKYLGRNFLKAVNYFTFTFLITIKSLKDLMNALPDLPPVANHD